MAERLTTKWEPCGSLPAYEHRINESGHRETRPMTEVEGRIGAQSTLGSKEPQPRYGGVCFKCKDTIGSDEHERVCVRGEKPSATSYGNMPSYAHNAYNAVEIKPVTTQGHFPVAIPEGAEVLIDENLKDGSIYMTNSRYFSTGATRDTDEGKFDYEGFDHPLVDHRFAAYMHQHRKQSDGRLRDGDNWTKGMPRRQYLKSLIRHIKDVQLISKGCADKASTDDLVEALCAVRFNVNGLLLELLLERSIE